MAPGRARDERKERQWRRWISQGRASGLSVRDFCTRHGLATASFYHWRRVLERRAAEPPAFVPVQLVTDRPPAQASARAGASRWPGGAGLSRLRCGHLAAAAHAAAGGSGTLNFPRRCAFGWRRPRLIYAVASTGWPPRCGSDCTTTRSPGISSFSGTSVATGSSSSTGTRTATSSFISDSKRAFVAGRLWRKASPA
jgi:hypothetical protein